MIIVRFPNAQVIHARFFNRLEIFECVCLHLHYSMVGVCYPMQKSYAEGYFLLSYKYSYVVVFMYIWYGSYVLPNTQVIRSRVFSRLKIILRGCGLLTYSILVFFVN